MEILTWILFGALVGFIADVIDTKHSGGLITNIFFGIVGSFVGSWLYSYIGPYFNINGDIQPGFSFLSISVSVVGALVTLFIWRLLFGSR